MVANVVRLGDVAELNGGFAFKSEQYTPSGHFVLRTVNIRDDFSITREGATFISEATASEFERFTLYPYDTLFVMVGATLGKIGFVRNRDLPALLNQNMWVIRAKREKIHPVYLHYCFRELSKIPISWASGSARGFLRRDDVRNLEFELPSLRDQKSIAEALQCLDDKIELNRRMNETLEAMAQAIFRDWFVDFGPVRRKLEGATDPLKIMGGLVQDKDEAARLADRFPAALAENGMPEGWEERTIGDVAAIRGGKQLPKTDFVERGGVPVFGGAGRMGFTNKHNAEGYVITVGRVGAYCGQFFGHRGKAWVNNNASQILPDKETPGEWLFLALKNVDTETIKRGAAQPFVSNGDVGKLSIIWPGKIVLTAFQRLALPLVAKQEQASIESQTLAAMRDLLLPKLMSGEIRLKDAEKIAEAAE